MISPASPLHQHHPSTSPWLLGSVPSAQPSHGRTGNRMHLAGGGAWGQGMEGCGFLTGLGREGAEAEQFSGIAVALTVSQKKKKKKQGWEGVPGGGGGLQGQRVGAQPPAPPSTGAR